MSQQNPESPHLPEWVRLDCLVDLSEELAKRESPPFARNMVPGMHINRGWEEHGGVEVDMNFEAKADHDLGIVEVEYLLDDEEFPVAYSLGVAQKSSVYQYPAELLAVADAGRQKLPALRRGQAVMYVYSLSFKYDRDEFHWKEAREYATGRHNSLRLTVPLESGSIGEEVDEMTEEQDKQIAAELGLPYIPNPAKLRLVDAFTLMKLFDNKLEIMTFDSALPELD